MFNTTTSSAIKCQTHLLIRYPVSEKIPPREFQDGGSDLHLSLLLDVIHPFVDSGARLFSSEIFGILSSGFIRKIPKQPFEITRDKDIHGWAARFLYTTILGEPIADSGKVRRWMKSTHPGGSKLLISARSPESCQDVVRVGSDYQLRHWETHSFGVVSGENVAKVPCRDGVLNHDLRVSVRCKQCTDAEVG